MNKPFKVGETVVEWCGSFGRYPNSVRKITKVFKRYAEDNFKKKWDFEGFEYPKSFGSSRIERVTEESVLEIRTWFANKALKKLLDEVSVQIRRGDVDLEHAEELLPLFQAIVPNAEAVRASNEEDDDFTELLAKHKSKNKKPKPIPVDIILSWLSGQRFINPRGVDASDFIKRTAASVD